MFFKCWHLEEPYLSVIIIIFCTHYIKSNRLIDECIFYLFCFHLRLKFQISFFHLMMFQFWGTRAFFFTLKSFELFINSFSKTTLPRFKPSISLSDLMSTVWFLTFQKSRLCEFPPFLSTHVQSYDLGICVKDAATAKIWSHDLVHA